MAAVTSAGQGPFSAPIEVVTAEGGILAEPEGGSFVSSIGFIVVMVVPFLLLIVLVVVVVLVTRYKCSKGKSERRYHCKHRGTKYISVVFQFQTLIHLSP